MRASLPLLLFVAASGLTVEAQESPSQTAVEKVAPFIDDLTRGVIHIDLKRADVEPLMDLAVPIVPQAAFYETPFRAEFQRLRMALRAAGIDEIFVVVSFAELPQQPWFVVAPCPDDLDSKELAPELPADLPERLGAKQRLTIECLANGDSGRVLFIGIDDILNRLTGDKPKPRPELAAAFEAAGDAPLRVVCIPTNDDRRVVEELFPVLPDALGGGPSTVLSRGLQWVAVAVDLKPEPRIRLVVESADAPAAEVLRRYSIKSLASYGQGELLVPQTVENRLVLALDNPGGGLKALQGLTLPLTRVVINRTTREQLKDIALAMANWHDTYRSFPAQAKCDDQGRPLLSWRVNILPFLGRDALRLYHKFKLDEPWDSEHNRPLVNRMPDVYRMFGSKVAHEGRTCYVRPVAENTTCPASRAIAYSDIIDGTSNTVMIVEVDDDHAVFWTKPEDLDFDLDNPAKGLGGYIDGAARAVFCDGQTHVLRNLLTDPDRADQLRAIFTRNGCESIRTID